MGFALCLPADQDTPEISYIYVVTVKTGIQECGMECGTEVHSSKITHTHTCMHRWLVCIIVRVVPIPQFAYTACRYTIILAITSTGRTDTDIHGWLYQLA